MCTNFFDCGCNCGHAIASAIYQSQRVALCCAAAAVAACLLVTLLITGGVGVGVGYHYCVVESKSYELDLQAFRNRYTTSSSNSATDTNKTEQLLRLRSEMKDNVKQLQPRIERKYVEDQTSKVVEARSSEDKGLQELLAQKIERHKRKKNPRKEYKRTTWLYKDNSDARLYHNPRHLNRTQLKQQRLYADKLSNKYNEMQNVKSMLLSKLGLNNVTFS